jgi:hypothetical protein
MSGNWATEMRTWASLGAWDLVQVRYIRPEVGTCELCGRERLVWYWDVCLREGDGHVHSIGRKCAPILLMMSNWDQRADAHERFKADGDDARVAKRRFNFAAKSINKRLRLIESILKLEPYQGRDAELQGLMTGSVTDQRLGPLGRATRDRAERARRSTSTTHT